MSQTEFINIIGRLFVDEQFRNGYLNATDIDQFINNLQGLDDAEKQFLRDEKTTVERAVSDVAIKYEFSKEGGPGRKAH